MTSVVDIWRAVDPEARLVSGAAPQLAHPVRTILRNAPQFMQPEGLLVVEIGHNRAAAETAFPRMPFVWMSTASSEDAVFVLKREAIVGGR